MYIIEKDQIFTNHHFINYSLVWKLLGMEFIRLFVCFVLFNWKSFASALYLSTFLFFVSSNFFSLVNSAVINEIYIYSITYKIEHIYVNRAPSQNGNYKISILPIVVKIT